MARLDNGEKTVRERAIRVFVDGASLWYWVRPRPKPIPIPIPVGTVVGDLVIEGEWLDLSTTPVKLSASPKWHIQPPLRNVVSPPCSQFLIE
jgi:hypothetical protein